MKAPIFFPATVALLSLALGACSSTVQSRIESHPGKFAALSGSHKEAVLAGEIKQGMVKDAVFLSWGSPGGIKEGVTNGGAFEKWRYVGQRQVVTSQVSVGYGYGGGRYGRYCDPFYYGGGPTVTYIPYTAAVVEFRGGKVVSWEREK
jgi:hypothetical protein